MNKQYFFISQSKGGFFQCYEESTVDGILKTKENVERCLGDRIVFLSEVDDIRKYASLVEIIHEADSSGKIDVGALEKIFKIEPRGK